MRLAGRADAVVDQLFGYCAGQRRAVHAVAGAGVDEHAASARHATPAPTQRNALPPIAEPTITRS